MTRRSGARRRTSRLKLTPMMSSNFCDDSTGYSQSTRGSSSPAKQRAERSSSESAPSARTHNTSRATEEDDDCAERGIVT